MCAYIYSITSPPPSAIASLYVSLHKTESGTLQLYASLMEAMDVLESRRRDAVGRREGNSKRIGRSLTEIEEGCLYGNTGIVPALASWDKI